MIAHVVAVAGRILLALLFILAGAAKIAGRGPFLEHMKQEGVPGVLLPAVIALELGAGLALAAGWRTAWAAGALAAFCLATAIVFHRRLGERAERTLFFKDLALAGALALIAAGVAGG